MRRCLLAAGAGVGSLLLLLPFDNGEGTILCGRSCCFGDAWWLAEGEDLGRSCLWSLLPLFLRLVPPIGVRTWFIGILNGDLDTNYSCRPEME